MSNKYWGWGLEDDEFFVRMRQANYVIERPKGIHTGRSGTFRHVHVARGPRARPRDNAKCYNQVGTKYNCTMHSNVMCNINNKCVKTQRNKTRRRDKETGLANTLYKVSARRELVIDTAPVTFLDIQLGESYIHTDRGLIQS